MFEKEKKQVLDAALEIRRCSLVSLSGGNISMRVGEDRYLVTPSGMIYEQMVPEDVCLIDGTCRVVEGNRKPSSDSSALVYLFEHMPKVQAVIHTHQPWATAAGFAADEIPDFLVTIMDACRNPVRVAPFTPSSAVGMGKLAVEYAGDSLAVILKHHGVITWGGDLQEALYAAVYLEEAAKTYVLAKAMGVQIPALPPELIAQEKAGWETYGQ
ncbi:MAG: class II aldolase/adducin family protein [Lachnospiraceae bacterium]|jgi:L-ribulose-5-phosphate 4-epimerase|nr:class II aldolase/adducin family protein [Lachnospiraceae bacterium]